MSTILMAILIIALTVIIPWFFIARHKKILKRQDRANFQRFKNAGAEHGLVFSRQEIIKNKIVGFDNSKRQLMIVEMQDQYDSNVFALKELKSCEIEKEYWFTGDRAGERERILQEIRLVFTFIDKRPPATLLFYSYDKDSVYLVADMQAKAEDWQVFVSNHLAASLIS